MSEIPDRFRKQYPDAVPLVEALGFVKVRANAGWWWLAGNLLCLAPVLKDGELGINDYHAAAAIDMLNIEVAARKTRGSPQERCCRLLALAKERPGVMVIDPGLDSVTWRKMRHGVKLSLTFRDDDFQATHELKAPDYEAALAAAAHWPDDLSAECVE